MQGVLRSVVRLCSTSHPSGVFLRGVPWTRSQPAPAQGGTRLLAPPCDLQAQEARLCIPRLTPLSPPEPHRTLPGLTFNPRAQGSRVCSAA